jgi:hypothetical protein
MNGNSAERTISWNVSLYLPALADPNNFVQGQKATRGGMWFCKGRLDERTYEIESRIFRRTDSDLGKRLEGQVKRARHEALKLQELYVKLGPDSNLHNANYELQFSFDYIPSTRQMEVQTYGYRTPDSSNGRAKVFTAKTVRSAFRQYREELEALVGKQR